MSGLLSRSLRFSWFFPFFSVHLLISFMKPTDFVCLLLPDSVIENPSLTHEAAPGARCRVDSTGAAR
ncbi:hypothetical protein [Paraburkholderia sartisoli]|uniref:hypothetical protein n=1 Tax=Paraburkholderia sartisoli TaxID=83784 RepID=UPI000B82ADEE|nr:hypothetical protein [Paraburkholderia sartisoli]